MRDLSNSIEGLRMVKTKNEIRNLRKAAKLTLGLYDIIDRKMTERENAAELIKHLTKNKAGFAFDPIIAYDSNGALPHAKVTDSQCKRFLLADIGAKYNGYHGDVTRSYCFKKDKKFDKVYEIVKEAHDLGIDLVAPGIKASDVDKVVRGHLKKHGYDLVHSTGHGIGLTIHEKPYISYKSDTVLEENMVFTIEPGVYLKGKFGIRIEDDILVTKTGCKVLSK